MSSFIIQGMFCSLEVGLLALIKEFCFLSKNGENILIYLIVISLELADFMQQM